MITSYKVTWNLWNITPIDCGILLIALIITIFASIEDGICFAIAASAAVLLLRVEKPTGQFLGRIKVAEIVNPRIFFMEDDLCVSFNDSSEVEIQQVLSHDSCNATDYKKYSSGQNLLAGQVLAVNPQTKFATRWVPLTKDNINLDIDVATLPDGVIVFRLLQSFVYPNSSQPVDQVSDEAKRLTRRGRSYDEGSPGDRPWNDTGPLRWKLPFIKWAKEETESLNQVEKPLLRIVQFDFSCLAMIDSTSV